MNSARKSVRSRTNTNGDPGGGGPVDASSSGDTTKGSNKPPNHKVEVAPKTSSGPKKAGPNLKKEPAHFLILKSFRHL